MHSGKEAARHGASANVVACAKAIAFPLATALTLAGCATPANHYDPLESVNRKVYAFNDKVDRAVMQPVARGYVAVTPSPIRRGVSNFFGNLNDIYVGASDLLEGNVVHAGGDLGRVLVNSTFGLFGLLDIATPIGLMRHEADLGSVLGHWGVGSGPFIVVPFLGPKTLRDSADWLGTYYASPIRTGVHDTGAQNSLYGMRFIDQRAALLGASKLVSLAAFGDEYSFVRDSYLQRRYNLNWDGNPPKPLKLGDDEDDDDLDATPPQAPAAGDAQHK